MRRIRRRQRGDGSVIEKHHAFHLRYWVDDIVDGRVVRVQRSLKLCDKDDNHFSKTCDPVRRLAADKLNELRKATPEMSQTMSVASFWETVYVPFIEENLKPSSVSGYKQIWNQHLKQHFADTSLSAYRTHHGSKFLLSLTKTQGLRTLNHIRSLASGVFSHAVNIGLLETNPWHGVKILGRVKSPAQTPHYTLEEAEDIISALVDHVDCQLVMALSCFLGLRPGEIAGLRWEDFDSQSVHIRRSFVRGVIGTPKTPESIASLPLIDQVRVPLELWRAKSGNPTQGWLIPTSTGNPTDLRDVVARKIRPTLAKKKVVWKGLYAGRRGAGTAVIGLTNGNYAAAQELLRHKNMTTTLMFYKKQTQTALTDGVKALEGWKSGGNGGGK